MIKRIYPRKWVRDTRGASSIEFALILTVLLLIILGVIQFGLCWYTKYALACASREGARYGVLLKHDASSNPIKPVNKVPSIEKVVRDYITGLCPSLSQDKVSVNVSGTGYTTGNPGDPIVVQVTSQNPWNLLGPFIPSLNNLTFAAETTMKCE